MGVELLCESNMENLLAHVKDIPNDRAVLRAMHFYEENRRVADAVKAVENKDGEGFLRLLEESGNSSWEWLQNCYSLQNCKEQKITLSLALTKLFLNKIGAGICRVHGWWFCRSYHVRASNRERRCVCGLYGSVCWKGKCLSDEYQEYRGCSC